MQIIRAQVMGMCFGVRDALSLADSIPAPHNVTIYGELVHNETVLSRLKKRGFQSVAETGRTEAILTESVLILSLIHI